MAAHGKNIQLYLMDGDASGRIKCSLVNWTGVAYKIPRIELNKCKDRADLKQSGVYFLFGKSDETEKQEDMLFTSPSYAAMFVIGKSANGLTSWKDEHGKTLKALESSDSVA